MLPSGEPTGEPNGAFAGGDDMAGIRWGVRPAAAEVGGGEPHPAGEPIGVTPPEQFLDTHHRRVHTPDNVR